MSLRSFRAFLCFILTRVLTFIVIHLNPKLAYLNALSFCDNMEPPEAEPYTTEFIGEYRIGSEKKSSSEIETQNCPR